MAPLLPPAPERRLLHPARLRVPDRVALGGVMYVLRTGVAWRDVPAEAAGCSGATAWRRLRDWTEAVRRLAASARHFADRAVAGRPAGAGWQNALSPGCTGSNGSGSVANDALTCIKVCLTWHAVSAVFAACLPQPETISYSAALVDRLVSRPSSGAGTRSGSRASTSTRP
jgi:transposase